MQEVLVVYHLLLEGVVDVDELDLYFCCFLLFVDVDFCGQVVLQSLFFSMRRQTDHATNCIGSTLACEFRNVRLEEV